jgi:hypothetical protein
MYFHDWGYFLVARKSELRLRTVKDYLGEAPKGYDEMAMFRKNGR